MGDNQPAFRNTEPKRRPQDGVLFRHPKIPFEFRCREPRIDLDRIPSTFGGIATLNGSVRAGLARRSYLPPTKRTVTTRLPTF
jgi:hypothetical protein